MWLCVQSNLCACVHVKKDAKAHNAQGDPDGTSCSECCFRLDAVDFPEVYVS